MSVWGWLTGSDAAKEAAEDTYQKQLQAIKGLTDYGDQYRSDYAGLSRAYDPYVSTGYAANSAVGRLMSDPASVRSLPGYQFALDEVLNGVERSAAARGMLNSGRAGKDVMKYATGYADQSYGDQLSRLMGVSNQGLAATSAQVGTQGQGLQGQLATRQSAYGGNMQAAGTIGQGEVAAANANTSFINNILGTAANLAGAYMGGGGSRGSSYMSNPIGMGGYGGARVGYGPNGNYYNYG